MNEPFLFLHAVYFAWGMILCFAGYRFFKFGLLLSGLLVGGFLGTRIALYYGVLPLEWIILAGFIGGVIGAGVVAGGLFLGVFLYGSLLTAMVCKGIFHIFTAQIDQWLLTGISVMGGVILVKYYRYLLIWATSFLGAGVIVNTLLSLTAVLRQEGPLPFWGSNLYADMHMYVFALYYSGFIIIGVAGALYQINTLPKNFKHPLKYAVKNRSKMKNNR